MPNDVRQKPLENPNASRSHVLYSAVAIAAHSNEDNTCYKYKNAYCNLSNIIY